MPLLPKLNIPVKRITYLKLKKLRYLFVCLIWQIAYPFHNKKVYHFKNYKVMFYLRNSNSLSKRFPFFLMTNILVKSIFSNEIRFLRLRILCLMFFLLIMDLINDPSSPFHVLVSHSHTAFYKRDSTLE